MCASPDPRVVVDAAATISLLGYAAVRARTHGFRPRRGGRRRGPRCPGRALRGRQPAWSARVPPPRRPRPAPRRARGRRVGRPRRRAGAAPLVPSRPRVTISRTSGVPTVRVPVLSNRTVRASPSVSIAPAPLTITPDRAARERPDTSAIGAARISGQGVATTTTASARTGIAAQRPREPRDQQCRGKEEAGVAVGHPHHRRPLRLRLLDQPHQRGVRAVARGPVGADIERRCRRWRSR